MAGVFRRTTCRGRTKKACSSAKKSCKYAKGSKRSFCRKRTTVRRRKN